LGNFVINPVRIPSLSSSGSEKDSNSSRSKDLVSEYQIIQDYTGATKIASHKQARRSSAPCPIIKDDLGKPRKPDRQMSGLSLALLNDCKVQENSSLSQKIEVPPSLPTNTQEGERQLRHCRSVDEEGLDHDPLSGHCRSVEEGRFFTSSRFPPRVIYNTSDYGYGYNGSYGQQAPNGGTDESSAPSSAPGSLTKGISIPTPPPFGEGVPPFGVSPMDTGSAARTPDDVSIGLGTSPAPFSSPGASMKYGAARISASPPFLSNPLALQSSRMNSRGSVGAVSIHQAKGILLPASTFEKLPMSPFQFAAEGGRAGLSASSSLFPSGASAAHQLEEAFDHPFGSLGDHGSFGGSNAIPTKSILAERDYLEMPFADTSSLGGYHGSSSTCTFAHRCATASRLQLFDTTTTLAKSEADIGGGSRRMGGGPSGAKAESLADQLADFKTFGASLMHNLVEPQTT